MYLALSTHFYGSFSGSNAGFYINLVPTGHFCGIELHGTPGQFCDIDG